MREQQMATQTLLAKRHWSRATKAARAVPALAAASAFPSSHWLESDEYADSKRKLRFRTIWISDVHLGTAGCNAELLLNFLKSTESETLYLVGDIIDGWRLKRSWYWPDAHNDIIRRVLKKAKRGTKVIYIPGNHDEAARQFIGLNFGGVQLLHDAIHETADGRRLWVLHGDAFDGVVLYARWLAFLGDYAYGLLLRLNVVVNAARRALGFDYWSLSAFLKRKVKNAVEYVGRFEEAVIQAAEEHHVDGVICGHIHSAEIRPMGKLTYYNDGDWVESCTALVEHADGRMEILHWADMMRAKPLLPIAVDVVQPEKVLV
jgi:UDP-2,3-diacylglucosamine pyrophosphatase LpxH